ncbi:YheC/YheD family protein [Paenibacillus beijingensis]|uniref:YheC/YheD family endospore coat-associated protein n=1 Tax=Paenibacillus beijingensis TaxID=1126833 RepID=UPI0009E47F06|nr:YheC/YheD family protein [Paenibacillus beijingensis]
MTQPVLGILTLYLNDDGLLEEKTIYRRMTVAGRKMGLEVFVFTPQDVNYSSNRIHAHMYDPDKETWSRKWRPFPNLIYDRCRIQRSHRFEQLKKFRARYGHLTFLNRPLRNKWTVYLTLKEDARFRERLPETDIYEKPQDLADMLRKYPLVYVKPINGTGGRGILRIEKQKNGGYLIQGRDQARRIIPPQKADASTLFERLASWDLNGRRYVVQQGIQLKLSSGRVHDYRLLVQKNSRGEWAATGGAGRIGAARSVTSNLHGGGKAVTMKELLGKWIGDDVKAESIRLETEKFGIEVAAYLERQYGRLCELALDIAIDRKGSIWLLEVNPKPAREVFAKTGDTETYQRAIARPLEYAMWLYERKKRSSRTNGGRRHSARGRAAGSRTAEKIRKTSGSRYGRSSI